MAWNSIIWHGTPLSGIELHYLLMNSIIIWYWPLLSVFKHYLFLNILSVIKLYYLVVNSIIWYWTRYCLLLNSIIWFELDSICYRTPSWFDLDIICYWTPLSDLNYILSGIGLHCLVQDMVIILNGFWCVMTVMLVGMRPVCVLLSWLYQREIGSAQTAVIGNKRSLCIISTPLPISLFFANYY